MRYLIDSVSGWSSGSVSGMSRGRVCERSGCNVCGRSRGSVSVGRAVFGAASSAAGCAVSDGSVSERST